MNVFQVFTHKVAAAAKALPLDAVDWNEVNFARVVVEPPNDPAHGDMATNAAMVLAKPLGRKPRDLAAGLCEQLTQDPLIEEANVAGPGFVNLRLKPSFWTDQLVEILKAGERYGADIVPDPRKINVEYVSANPTGPMHVGHCRGAVVGDTLANLLSFVGHDVTKEYYTNDAGVQIDVLARSVILRMKEALGEDIGPIPEGLYPGDYLIPVAKALAEEFGAAFFEKSNDEQLSVARDRAILAMMELIRGDLAVLNVRHDLFFSERSLHQMDGNQSRIDAILADLEKRDLVYVGQLPPPKGQLPEDWEDRPQTLMRTSDFGDDIDRPLKKSDGEYTYFAADVAYFEDKFQRGFDEMCFVLGADHAGYVKRLKAVAAAVSDGKADLTVLLCQLVKLMRDDQPVKMGKRTGEFVTLREVVEEVGVDAVRFMMLYRKSDAPLDFDFAKVTEQSKDNPVFYVQYAHARTHSVFNMAEERTSLTKEDWLNLDSLDLSRLNHDAELEIIRKMAVFPRLLSQAMETKEPHRLAFYLYDLASDFHAIWNLGKENEGLRFIIPQDLAVTKARLALVHGVNYVLRAGLGIMGVSAPLEMR
ncbi:MAG: arginine--tRNA ligase [Pseudomonadota bacterium]